MRSPRARAVGACGRAVAHLDLVLPAAAATCEVRHFGPFVKVAGRQELLLAGFVGNGSRSSRRHLTAHIQHSHACSGFYLGRPATHRLMWWSIDGVTGFSWTSVALVRSDQVIYLEDYPHRHDRARRGNECRTEKGAGGLRSGAGRGGRATAGGTRIRSILAGQ